MNTVLSSNISFIILIVLCFTFSPAIADHAYDICWEEGFAVAGIDGQVNALTVYNGCVIAGGVFEVAGNAVAQNLAAWDGTSWAPISSGFDDATTNPRVYALTVYDGKLIVGGLFDSVDGVPAKNVACWNGSKWDSLEAGVKSYVYALTVFDGELIVGGQFTVAGDLTVNNITSWNGSEWDSLGSGVNYGINALTVFDNKLIAGGRFTAAGDLSASRIASWNGSEWDSLSSGVDDVVEALTVYNNQLIAGGSFLTAGGDSSPRIAAWNGAGWTTLGTGMDDTVFELSVYNNQLIAAGGFSTAGDVPATRIAAWNGASWANFGTGMDGVGYRMVYAVANYGDLLIAGGGFNQAGGHIASNIAAWDGGSWFPLSSGWAGKISALTTYFDLLVAGGSFSSIGGVTADNIAAWNGTTWVNLGAGVNGEVNALTVCNFKLIVGGNFTTAGGISADYIAAWDYASWSAMGTYVVPNSAIRALGCYDGKVIAGTQSTIWSWDGLSWDVIGYLEPYWNAIDIRAFTVYDDRLIVAGSFSSINGVSAIGVAAWDGSNWSNIGPGGTLWTYALGVYGNKLYVGGTFGHLCCWDGVTWSNLEPAMGEFDITSAFAVFNNELIVGGEFPYEGTGPGNNIAAWNGATWAPLGSGLNRSVNSLAVFSGNLYAAGSFTVAGGKVSAYLARWTKSEPVAAMINGFRAIPTDNGIELSWSLTSDEEIDGFRIYRSQADDTVWHLLNNTLIESTERRYLDKTALPGISYQYTLAVIGSASGEVLSAPVSAERAHIEMKLYQNSPNPFNLSTTISFTLPEKTHAILSIFNIEGKLIKTIFNNKLEESYKQAIWDGTDSYGNPVSSGVYFYCLKASGKKLTKKMVLLK